MMYIVSADDGVTEIDEVVQSALARVLLDATAKATKLAITEVDCTPDEITRSEIDGSVVILKDGAATRTCVLHLTDDESKGVMRLNQLAMMAMNIRDMVHTSLLQRLLKENSNEVDFERNGELSGQSERESGPSTVDLGQGKRVPLADRGKDSGSDQD